MKSRESKPTGLRGPLTGQRRWKLVVSGPKEGEDTWEVHCDCGKVLILTRKEFKSSRSCGCHKVQQIEERIEKLNIPRRKKKRYHACQSAEEYDVRNIWKGVMARCYDPKNQAYKDYGGRGIKVASRWLSFDVFFHDMGPRPTPHDAYSIEREDVNGNYEKGNCKWILKTLQGRNTRRTIRLIYKGINTTLMEFLELYPTFERKDFMFVSKELKKNGRKPVDVTKAVEVLCHFKGVTPP